MSEKVNLARKFASLDEIWVPKVVCELNQQYVKIARFHGEYVWHAHEREDEMFLVLSGKLRIKLRDRDIELEQGELFVVPRGVEHKPVAPEPVEALLFEPATTRNTGNVDHDFTIEAEDLERM